MAFPTVDSLRGYMADKRKHNYLVYQTAKPDVHSYPQSILHAADNRVVCLNVEQRNVHILPFHRLACPGIRAVFHPYLSVLCDRV